MNCNGFRHNCLFFLEGQLSRVIEKEMKEHLESCEACKSKYERMKKTFKLLRIDKVPLFGEPRKSALFPLVMEQVEERSKRTRRRKYAFAWSFGFTMLLALISTIIGIKSQKPMDYQYAFMTNPNNLIYQEDSVVTNYIAESLIENDTLIKDVKTAIDNSIIQGSELSSLMMELSSEEISTLIEKLKNTNFDNI